MCLVFTGIEKMAHWASRALKSHHLFHMLEKVVKLSN